MSAVDIAAMLDKLLERNPYPQTGKRVEKLEPPRCGGFQLPGMAHAAKCAGFCEQIRPKAPPPGEPAAEWHPVYYTGLCRSCSDRERDYRERKRRELEMTAGVKR